MILAEMNELSTLGLLGTTNSDGQVVRVGETIEGLSGFGTWGGGVDLATVRLTEMGATVHRLMGLGQVPAADLDDVTRALHGLPEGSSPTTTT